MDTIKSENEFIDWLIANRHNAEVSDETYSEMVDFHLHYFRPDLHPYKALLSKDELAELIEYWRTGNKLQAVKRFKEISLLGLKEAKDWCDTHLPTLIKTTGTLTTSSI